MDEDGRRIHASNLAARYRAHLTTAGIDRPELFETTDARRQIRLHDTRATFVTLALANGKTEAFVQARTGTSVPGGGAGHNDSSGVSIGRRVRGS